MKTGGVVAAGHPATAAAAAEILSDGGTAFDAVLAALAAACVAEPVLASLGGGGFLLARPERGSARLFDFFVQTPRVRRPAEAVDFRAIAADFGPATQPFQIGLGAAATPGTVAGLFAAHRALGRVPMRRLVEPAVRLAKEGAEVTAIEAYIATIVAPILTADPVTAQRFASREQPGRMLAAGERFVWPELADTLEALGYEGERLFYEGEIARAIADASAARGGHLTTADLAGYRVELRAPLVRDFRGARILANPPPAAGGVLVALGLALIDAVRAIGGAFGSPAHVAALVAAMRQTGRARREHDAKGGAADLGDLLDPALIEAQRAALRAPQANRGTTHISVVDAKGNAAALTVSNGEGCGVVIPGTGFMLNNMLGEDDLNPGGFHRWPTAQRLSSMMAPTVVLHPDGGVTALGSGGSHRIRSAVFQVLVNLLALGLGVEAAVTAPRLHLDGSLLHHEPGFGQGAIGAALDDGEEAKTWPAPNLYFGGVHTVRMGPGGRPDGHGDPRRGGVVRVV